MLRPGAPLSGAFVTGTDTGVGKTLVSAMLAMAWQATYWKPVQTGAAQGDDDTATVKQLAGLPPERVAMPGRVYQAPEAPERAAALEGTQVRVADLHLPSSPGPLVVEGAGGVLVPLGPDETMLDLMGALGLGVVVVARSTLGTINHTLLTLEALRGRHLRVLGVILSGPPLPHNREAIERHGRVRVLAEIPVLEEVTPAAVTQLARSVPLLEELA